ncbi:MAG: hypothetical protein A2Y15_06505 [Clostridiales bacterium GWF2_36_10]|nr:MAG: hypothetical protein A2Y15_06505 [Clostridiales bacterium GWF2_36_10]HAN20639.1 hypothetical protein [Clostridiales bacterium]
MKNHSEKAAELFREGYNCAQSVFAAYCDVTNIDKETALKLSSSFGGGMGRLREVCGALTGAFMVAGIIYGYTSPADDIAKAEHYALIQKIAKKFKERNGTIICRELLELSEKHSLPTPVKRNEEYYATRPCERFVYEAAEIMDEILKEK